MKLGKGNLSKLTGNTSRGFKKIALSAIVFSSLTLGIEEIALADEDLNFKTVYYVYLDDQYIGTVSDKALVENVIQDKLNHFNKTYEENLEPAVGSDLTYITEQVFQSVSNTTDDRVVETLEEQLSIEAKGASIMIDGKAAVYVEDEAAAQQVIEQIKLKYITKEQLEDLKVRKANPSLPFPELKEDEARILDIRLSENVTVTEDTALPQEILTVEKAVETILKGKPVEVNYKVEVGDVLGKIANEHNMSLEELLEINPSLNAESILKIDQVVNVLALQPYFQVIVDKEIFKKENIPFEKEVIDDASMFRGATKVQQEGKNGLREVTYKISEQNGAVVNLETVRERRIEEPVKHIVIKGTKAVPSRGDGSFAWPAVGGYISSKQGTRWGRLHKGIDIARPSETTIKASDNGKVVFAGWSSGYGNKVEIDHQNGFRTVYAHLSSISVDVGQTVPKGTKIGVMGSTGNSTGVHLHFEIYKDGSLKNPLDYIR